MNETYPMCRTVGHVPNTVPVDSVNNVDDVDSRLRNSNYGYQVSTGYVNTLSYPLVIIQRSNHAIRLPPSKSIKNESDERGLRIDVVISFNQDVDLDVTHMLDDLEEDASLELKALREAVKNNRVKLTYGKSRIMLSYTVNDRTIRKNNFSVYISELDVVLCKNGYESNSYHPYSLKGQELLTDETPNMFNYRVLINDPDKLFGARYINVNGVVYHVPASADIGMRAGVYVYSSQGTSGSQPVFLEFDEADDKLALFPSAKLASELGDVNGSYKSEEAEQAHKRNMEKMQMEMALTKAKNEAESSKTVRDTASDEQLYAIRHEHEKLKLENQLESQRLERLKADIEETAKRREHDLQKMKHNLEMTSMQTKTGTEAFKWLPAIASAIGALFNVFI